MRDTRGGPPEAASDATPFRLIHFEGDEQARPSPLLSELTTRSVLSARRAVFVEMLRQSAF